MVAGVDLRSDGELLPRRIRPVGLVLFVLGGGLFIRAMGENPFFEKTVRIQHERDHHVIETGPYRFVRHPGYVGLVAWVLSFPLLLTSPRAFLPAGLTAICLVVRTALEDRTLHNKLPGYADYATRVRSRLVPRYLVTPPDGLQALENVGHDALLLRVTGVFRTRQCCQHRQRAGRIAGLACGHPDQDRGFRRPTSRAIWPGRGSGAGRRRCSAPAR